MAERTSERAAVRAAIAQRSADLGDQVDLFEDDLGAQGVSLTVWTPAGHVWVATGSHCIAGFSYTVPGEAYGALLVDMGHGVERCQLADCDSCDPVA